MTPESKILLGIGAMTSVGLAWRFLAPFLEYRLHVLNEQKFVDADPRGLAHVAGTSLDVYALASAMQSEEKTRAGHIAIGCAIRNYCRKHKVSISQKLLQSVDKHGRKCPSHGHFGSQEAPGKWASTAKPPTANTLIVAQQILATPSPIVDVTHGATKWFAPAAQDAAHALDPRLYSLDAAGIVEKVTNEGGKMVLVNGVPNTVFWRFA